MQLLYKQPEYIAASEFGCIAWIRVVDAETDEIVGYEMNFQLQTFTETLARAHMSGIEWRKADGLR